MINNVDNVDNVDNVESVEPFGEKMIDLQHPIKVVDQVEVDWFLSKFEDKFKPNAKLANDIRGYSEVYTGYQDECIADNAPLNKVVSCMGAINNIHDNIPYKAVIKAVATLDIDAAAYMLSIMGEFPTGGRSLVSLFTWGSTPQGFDYWYTLDKRIKRIKGIGYV